MVKRQNIQEKNAPYQPKLNEKKRNMKKSRKYTGERQKEVAEECKQRIQWWRG